MKKRDEVRVKHERPIGILNVCRSESLEGVTRYWPSPDLEPFVEHYWVVRWDLPEPQVVETVPIASVHMVLEPGESKVYGVMRARFSRLLSGRGRVIGTRFRAGAFRPFMTASVRSLTDHSIPLTGLFGAQAARLEDRALRLADDRRAILVIERFLRSLRPSVDDAMLLSGRIAARIAQDRGVMRVDRLAREFGVGRRGLERLFREYVGVSPKWVIQRYRLLEAADRVASGNVVDWADLALDLGFADQAHFIRAFKKLVGRPPAGYARNLGTPRGWMSQTR